MRLESSPEFDVCEVFLIHFNAAFLEYHLSGHERNCSSSRGGRSSSGDGREIFFANIQVFLQVFLFLFVESKLKLMSFFSSRFQLITESSTRFCFFCTEIHFIYFIILIFILWM